MSWSPTTPLVVFGDDWGRHVSTMQHIFRWVIPRHPVVWVNAIGHRKPRLGAADARRAWEKARAMLRPARVDAAVGGAASPPPAAVIQPRVLPWHDRLAVHAFNTWSLARSVRGALASLGLDEPPVIVTGSPPSVGVLGTLGELGSVYFCMDDFLHLPNVSADMLGPLERRLLDKVDAVVATAESLTRSKMPRSGRAYYLPQGVNFDHFAKPRPEPAEMQRLPRPRIGFAGGLYPRCDLALLRRLAERYREGCVVLVGPVAVDLSPLAGLTNVHLLGPRPYGELPAYVQAFDVGIIPYILNEETVAVDPLKLLEYLAAGIPVVTTALPEAAKYRSAVGIAGDAAAFVGEVDRALARDRVSARTRGQTLAREHSWTQRAERLLEILGETMGARPAPPVAVAR